MPLSPSSLSGILVETRNIPVSIIVLLFYLCFHCDFALSLTPDFIHNFLRFFFSGFVFRFLVSVRTFAQHEDGFFNVCDFSETAFFQPKYTHWVEHNNGISIGCANWKTNEPKTVSKWITCKCWMWFGVHFFVLSYFRLRRMKSAKNVCEFVRSFVFFSSIFFSFCVLLFCFGGCLFCAEDFGELWKNKCFTFIILALSGWNTASVSCRFRLYDGCYHQKVTHKRSTRFVGKKILFFWL